MNTTRRVARVVGIFSLLVSLVSYAGAAGTFAFGPIEQITSRTVTVLGQRYSLDRSSISTNHLTVGDLVLVEGAVDRKGNLAALSVRATKTLYAPGATDVALSGVVTNYDASKGFLTIGGLTIYSLEAVGLDVSKLAVGATVEVIGRQAAPYAALWAYEIHTTTQSIEGTGRATQSIEGTGSSTLSIEGTGRAAQSIEGAGLSTQSIEGTGRSTQMKRATALSAQSIEGTGRSAQSIEGTGRSAQSIEGTGLATQSIEGTGRSMRSIGGTGLSTQSIEGTGISLQSIEGTGRAF